MLLKVFRKIACRRNFASANPAKSPKNRMQAWQIHSYGDIGELQLTQARIPVIKTSTDVLVKVEAASINPIDFMMIKGYGKTVADLMRMYSMEFPMTLGRDFAGVVVDKGQEVEEFKIGDAVYGVLPLYAQGSHAEGVIADKSLICHKPKHLTTIESASILYAAITAWSALYITGELCFKDVKRTKILVLGASGGVGTLAVQILKAQNATVDATCSENAFALVRSLGADKLFDYTDFTFPNCIADEGYYDIVLDCAKFGHENVPGSWRYGKFVTLNSPLLINTDKYGLVGGLAKSAADLLLSNLSKSVRWGFFAPSSTGVQFIDRLVKAEKIQPVIHKVFKFDEMPQAFAAATAGHLRGKIVIDYM